ncbi:hypothetical protein KAR91_76010 [Candidatus Pacearchaeota archaeon]|nr:hypothetical protein [Candidatus Pacearchaeota archaeon]
MVKNYIPINYYDEEKTTVYDKKKTCEEMEGVEAFGFILPHDDPYSQPGVDLSISVFKFNNFTGLKFLAVDNDKKEAKAAADGVIEAGINARQVIIDRIVPSFRFRSATLVDLNELLSALDWTKIIQ